MDCLGHLIDDRGIHADSDKNVAHPWMAHTEEHARRAEVPQTRAIFGTFYARRICVYWPASRYTEERSSVLVETHASSMHG